MRKKGRLAVLLFTACCFFMFFMAGRSFQSQEVITEPSSEKGEEVQTVMLPFLAVGKEGTEDALYKIACIGDSITYGDGVSASIETESYPAILQRLLGEGYEVRNFGLSGSTLIKEGDFAYTESEQYNQSVEYEADLYIIMLGTNDSKPHNWSAALYREELDHMISEYRKGIRPPRILLLIPPKYFGIVRNDTDGSRIRNEIIRYRIGPILEETAEELDLELLDVYLLTEQHPEWFDDGLHPNADGNEAIAEAVMEMISQKGQAEETDITEGENDR